MKTIVHTKACPITADQALLMRDVQKPEPGPRDLLVREVMSISVEYASPARSRPVPNTLTEAGAHPVSDRAGDWPWQSDRRWLFQL